MTATEATARLEAKLRGWEMHPEGNGFACPDDCLLHPSRAGWHPATDPHTADGAWEWVKLACLEVRPLFAPYEEIPKWGFQKWTARPYAASTEPPTWEHTDPIAAVAAAVEALAAAHGEES